MKKQEIAARILKIAKMLANEDCKAGAGDLETSDPVPVQVIGADEEVAPKNPSGKMSRYEKLKNIVENGYSKIDGKMVDVFTASMLLKVYEALSDSNKEKFEKIPLVRLVDFGWRMMKRI